MKQIFIALAVIAAFAVAGGDERSQRPTASNVQEKESLYTLGRSLTYENVTVRPIIYVGDYQQRADYATLGEAMEKGWIEIVEMPEGGQVSQVTLKYTGKKPLLLLAGELLLGGQQDRVVAEDTVIDPLSTVVVKVYCVEPGRWGGRTMAFGYAGTQVPTNVKEQAILSGQSAVWDRTSGFNSLVSDDLASSRTAGRRSSRSGTGGGGTGGFGGGLAAYSLASPTTVGVGLKSVNVVEFTEAGIEELSSALEGEGAVVGMIFVINGEIRLMELFSDPSQLAESFEPILGGVLALASVTKVEEWKAPSEEVLNAFLNSAIEAKDDSSNNFLTGVGDQAKKVTSPGVRGSVIGGGGESGGCATHGSYFPNKKSDDKGTNGGVAHSH